MKKMFKKATTWLLVVCMFVGFVPAFGSAMAAEEKLIPAAAVVLDSEGDPEAPEEMESLRSDNIFDLLVDTLKAIMQNLRSLSVDQVLNLPANSMDDVVTYIFAIFKLFGLNIDSLYEKLSSIFFFM